MISKEFTDSQLIKAFQLGDNKAYEILLNRYQTRVFNFIYYKVCDIDFAKDIFQDTFCKAIIAIKHNKYKDNGKFLPWINRIAYNLISDFWSKNKEYAFTNGFINENDITNNALLSEKSIEDILSNEQVLKDVVRMIGFLPELQQEVVRMRYFESLSFNEIAEKTNVSINTIFGRMRYALMNLRKMATENNIVLELI